MSKKRIISLMVIGVLLSSVSVLATYLIESSDVEFDNTTANIPDANGDETVSVQEAIDYLINNMDSGGSGYKLTYDTQGGSNIYPSVVEKNSNIDISKIPIPQKTGYYFAGWYDTAEGGNKITSNTIIPSDTTIYAHWYQLSTSTLFINGPDGYNYFSTPITIYYNPVNPNDTCTQSNSVSTVGTKTGCMKWYAYSEKDGVLNMILDHNINPSNVGVAFINQSDFNNSTVLGPQLGVSGMCSESWGQYSWSAQNCRGPLTLLKYLQNNTPGWETTVQGDYATYTANTGYAAYSINYSVDYDNDGVNDYKARLITYEEASFLGCMNNSSSCPSELSSGLSNSTGYMMYWTISPSASSASSWAIDYNRNLANSSASTGYGVRPVISVSTSEIFS